MIIAPFIYPFAYALRWYIRTGEILVENYLYKWRKGWFWLWIYLNDSEVINDGTDFADEEKYYPRWIWNSKSDFLKSYWFNAIRNNGVNFNNYTAFFIIGKFIKVIKHYGSDKNFIEIRQFEKKTLPAINFYLFKKKFFIGYAKSGRLWIELFKNI
jgi:hypothetical protein